MRTNHTLINKSSLKNLKNHPWNICIPLYSGIRFFILLECSSDFEKKVFWPFPLKVIWETQNGSYMVSAKAFFTSLTTAGENKHLCHLYNFHSYCKYKVMLRNSFEIRYVGLGWCVSCEESYLQGDGCRHELNAGACRRVWVAVHGEWITWQCWHADRTPSGSL